MKISDVKSMVLIVPDQRISINGESFPARFTIPSPMPKYGEVETVQWFGDHGSIAMTRGPALGFHQDAPAGSPRGTPDAAWLAQFIEPWLAGRAAALRARHTEGERAAASYAEHVAAQEAAFASIEAGESHAQDQRFDWLYLEAEAENIIFDHSKSKAPAKEKAEAIAAWKQRLAELEAGAAHVVNQINTAKTIRTRVAVELDKVRAHTAGLVTVAREHDAAASAAEAELAKHQRGR